MNPDFISTSPLQVRRLYERDAPVLQTVFAACGDHFVATTGAAPGPEAALNELRGCAATPGREAALLLAGDEPVGALGWWSGYPEPGVALLGLLLVVPEQRRRGTARAALHALEPWLAAHDVSWLRAGVTFGDARAHAVARALGFHEMRQRTHVTVATHTRLMLTLYQKRLSAPPAAAEPLPGATEPTSGPPM